MSFQEVIFGKNNQFSSSWTHPILIIADKCEGDTTKMVNETGLPVVFTNYGNAGSLFNALELAVSKEKDDEIVYFCEDDYLHLPVAPKLIEEGIKRTDYLTLYDHPDKYTAQYNGGEFSKVIKTESSHWRYTISTCMTFATKVKTLREDLDIWRKHTSESHPHDHKIFTELSNEKNRRLAVCIPGAACHTDLEYSTRMKKFLIDPWAIELTTNALKKQILDKFNDWINSKQGLEKLLALDALKKHGFIPS